MSLDVWSASQRNRVRETIQAFCSEYDLHLVSLILCGTPGATQQSADFLLAHSVPVGKCEAVCGASFRAIAEPIIMAEDYKKMLTEASGRILVVSCCGQGTVCPTQERIQKLIIR